VRCAKRREHPHEVHDRSDPELGDDDNDLLGDPIALGGAR
jgi:hypothetical protein